MTLENVYIDERVMVRVTVGAEGATIYVRKTTTEAERAQIKFTRKAAS